MARNELLTRKRWKGFTSPRICGSSGFQFENQFGFVPASGRRRPGFPFSSFFGHHHSKAEQSKPSQENNFAAIVHPQLARQEGARKDAVFLQGPNGSHRKQTCNDEIKYDSQASPSRLFLERITQVRPISKKKG